MDLQEQDPVRRRPLRARGPVERPEEAARAYRQHPSKHNPIYVFDEWAADQDPSFRRYFYEEFLQSLRIRGKTIIAATHDDRYFLTLPTGC